MQTLTLNKIVNIKIFKEKLKKNPQESTHVSHN